jgi:hypothetical protein
MMRRSARAMEAVSCVAEATIAAGVLAACAAGPPPAPSLPSRTVSIELQTPDPAWSIQIVEARLVQGELWVLSELSRREGPAPQVISSASDTAAVSAPADAPVTHFVLGKSWRWGDEDSDLHFIDGRDEIGAGFRSGLRVYP